MKKVISVAMAAAMAVSLVACGQGGGNQDNAGKILIGGIGPTTGPNAQYGTAVRNGAEIAVEEINALGGDIQFAYKFEDDETDN